MRAMRAAAMAVGATVALALAPQVVATEEPGSEQGATGRVRIVDNRFRPRSVTVERGTRVRWSNAGRNAHTVTADNGSFDSGPLAPGDRFRRRFRRVGTFTYHCTIHPRMSGTIQVV